MMTHVSVLPTITHDHIDHMMLSHGSHTVAYCSHSFPISVSPLSHEIFLRHITKYIGTKGMLLFIT